MNKRVITFLLSVLLVVSCLPTALADDTQAVEPPQATEAPQTTDEPIETPQTTDEPQTTEAPTPEPTVEPTEAPTVEPMPERTVEPVPGPAAEPMQIQSGGTAFTINATSGDYDYVVNPDGTSVTITKYHGAGGDITIPGTIDGKTVTRIGGHSFQGCQRLQSITIPSNVVYIGEYAFDFCSNLASVSIPASVASIESGAFAECFGLTEINVDPGNTCYTSLSGVLFNETITHLIQYPLNSAVISYVIPDGVTTVMPVAFRGCRNLVNLTLPSSLIDIDYNNFIDNFKLASINVNESNTVFSSKNGVLFNRTKTKLLRYPKDHEGSDYTLPGSVTEICECAFQGCYRITNVNIPNSVNIIRDSAFLNCINLSPVVVPEGVQTIEGQAFRQCVSLESISLPESLSEIGSIAFEECNNLKTITIPTNVNLIGYHTFRSCTNLSKSIFKGNAPITMFDGTFEGCKTGFTVYYAKGKTGYTNPWYGYPAFEYDPDKPCSVYFNLNGAAGSPPVTQNIFFGIKAYEPPNPSVNGYTFGGWYQTPDCSGTVWDFNTPVNSNITLYARWQANIFTITFDCRGGNTLPDIKAAFGSAIAEPTASVKSGYYFTGWYPTPACDSAPITFPYTVKGNAVLYAKWQFIGMKPITSPGGPPSAYLAGVNYSAGSLSRSFSKTTTSYKITLGEGEGAATLTPIKQFDGASMTINGRPVSSYTANVANGKSVKVTVKVKYGRTSKTYTFTVTRAKSTNNNLGSLSATAGTWSQSFDPNVLNYILTLDENTKKVKIYGATASPLARPSFKSKAVSLNNGARKVIKLTVRAQSGARRTYTVTVVRAPSTNVNLKSIRASGLAPRFSPGVTEYSIILPVNKSSVSIRAGATGYKAKVTIDGSRKSSKKVVLASGQSAVVRITVTAQAGNSTEYLITVIRQ